MSINCIEIPSIDYQGGHRKLSASPGPRNKKGEEQTPRVEASTLISGANESKIFGEFLGDISACVEALPLNPMIRELLEEFTLFPNLPAELRIKIWRFAARSNERIFELIWHPHLSKNLSLSNKHDIFKVSKHSNRVPAIMEVNRESREEGMHIFEKRIINNYDRYCGFHPFYEGAIPCTWFNPDLDTIYFGANTCIRTVVDFFYLFGKLKIPRAAFICTQNEERECCSWNSRSTSNGWSEDRRMCRLRQAIGGGGCSRIQALHGIPENIALNDLVPGSESTREVFLVVRSQCDDYAAGEMPNTLTFRPALHNGITTRDKRAKNGWQLDIIKVRLGLDLHCGPFRWIDGRVPNFRFVSLAPEIKDGKGKVIKHDGIMVPAGDIEKLFVKDEAFVKDLKLRYRIEIPPLKVMYALGSSDNDIEIGLYNGTRRAIKKCKEKIEERLLLTWEEIHKASKPDVQ